MAAADGTSGDRLCTRCTRWKPIDEFYNYKRSKTGKCAACKLCMDLARAQWVAANPQKNREVERNARVKTREKRNGQIAAWGRRNRDRKDKVRTAWRERNRERDCGYTKAWQAKNPDKVNANTARRRSAKMRSQPSWANEFFIGEAYRLAKLRQKVCGGPWHVDHVVPLRSRVVCGLHVENNLRVIPATLNQRKSNRYWPDMP